MDRRDMLKSEITELQQRLGIKVITTRNLKSIEECRKAFVEIVKHCASISQGKLLDPGLETELDILRKKVKILQEENNKLQAEKVKTCKEIEVLQGDNKSLREDRDYLIKNSNTLYSAIERLNSKKWWQFWRRK